MSCVADIRTLQLILLKISLILGAKMHTGLGHKCLTDVDVDVVVKCFTLELNLLKLFLLPLHIQVGGCKVSDLNVSCCLMKPPVERL